MKELETQIQQSPESLAVALSALPRDRGGRISWKTLKQEPGRLESTVEQIAQIFMDNGVNLTNKGLNEAGQGAVLAGIHLYYPGALVGLRNRLGISEQKPFGYWKDKPEEIEEEARSFFEQHGGLSLGLLRAGDRNDLYHAVSKYYPGKMRALKKALGIPEGRNAVGYWTPEIIEREARDFLEREGRLSWTLLVDKKMGSLARGISDFYPGGMNQLRINLQIPLAQRQGGYWENVEVIREEARNAISSGVDISADKLARAGLSSLAAAINKYYPGKTRQLRVDLGLDQPKRPDDYWTAEAIEREAREVLQTEGVLSQAVLKRLGKGYLSSAISKYYPGGMHALKVVLEMKTIKPDGYWTTERIEQEALDFYLSHGALTDAVLNERGRADLAGALSKYPGRMSELKRKLGIAATEKPKGYWTPEQTEKEALEFFEKEGQLTHDILRERGRWDLLNAINGKYEGRMTTLRQKLGITEPKTSEEIVDSNRANEQLGKLLEVDRVVK